MATSTPTASAATVSTTAAPVTGQVVDDLNDPNYINWLKVNRALHCTTDVLQDVSETEMKSFHTSLLNKHGNTPCSKPCTHKDIKHHGKLHSWSIACPSNPKVCTQWLTDIVTGRTKKSTRLTWSNSDLSQWQKQPWQIAKIYMERQDMASVRPANTDPAGILQLLSNFKLFGQKMDMNKVEAVRSMRNTLAHSTDLKVTGSDLKTLIQTLINLLEDPLHLLNHPEAKQAVTDIRKIEAETVEVNSTAFLKQECNVWKQHIAGLAEDNKKDIIELIHLNTALATRLEGVIRRIEAVETQVTVQGEQLREHAQQLGDHVQQLGDHAQQLGDHDQQLGDHDQRLGDHDQQLGDHDQQLGDIPSVQNVLAKPHHQVNMQDLHVEPFFECLGLIPQYHDTTMPGGWIPNNVVVTGFSSRVFSFLQTSDVSRRLVDTEMAKVAAVVEWRTYDDTSVSVEMTCAITNTTKDAQRKAKTWSQDVSKKFLEVLETNFASDTIQMLQEAWQLFRKNISYVDDLDPSKTTVDISNDACTIYVTGQRTEVVNLFETLDKDYSKVQEEMNRAATIITETTSRHKLHQLRMLHAKAFASQQQKKFKDMKVVIDIQSQEVKFTGMPGDVTQAKLEMLEIFIKMSELKLDMSPSLINMLNGKGMRKHLVDEFRNKNICAVFNDMGGDKLGVYALSDDDVCAAVEVIKATTCEISFDAAINKMADPEKWNKLIKDQQSQHVDLLEISVSGTAVRLVGVKSRVDATLEVIKTFLKDNVISEQFVPMEHGVASCIDKYMRNKTDRIMQNLRHSVVKITVSLDGPYGYTVSGNSYGLQNAVQQVLKIPDEVRIQQFEVDEPGMPKFLQSVSGQHSLDTLGKRHNVVIEPVGKYVQKEDVLTSKTDHSAASDGFVSRVTLPGGATVEVIRGDMTKFQSDAIVNAANRQLEHWGGLARAIADAGGQEIQFECQNHMQRNGVLADGQVYVSTAGRLPCKKVIHAVGPKWKDGLSNEENNLFDAVFESLLAAQQCNLSSIAIPALSSGIFGFPIVKYTMIIVSAIKDFFDTQTHSSVKKVSLMDPKQDVVQTFHQSLCTVFGPKVMTTSENRQGNSQKKARRSTPLRKEQNLMPTSMTYSRTEKQTTRHTKEKSTPVKVNHRTAEGIVLILHKSEIANEKVDAIINSSTRNLQLNLGAVSQTLLQKGGNVIQMECQEKAPDGIKFGEVVVTSGGSLNCSHIVHGACCSWDGGKGQSEQVLRQLLTNCFETVHQLKLTSVAFPAIGTGQLGFPHRLVATVMLDELHQFSSRQPQTSLRDVRFVVYHKDQASIQAFEKVLKVDEAEEEAEEEETRPARALAKPEQGAVGGTTSHSIKEESDEMIHIGSIDVDIVLGDLTMEDTDAIVNSTSQNLDLNGATTKAIIEAGGPRIEEEMRKIGNVGSSGIAITTAGRLPCAHIIHIAVPQNGKSDWTTIIERALLEADALKIKSIAFPALGTGALGLKPSTMANAMLDAIERFTKRNPESTLKLVKIVIFQQSMMDSFRKSAYKKASGKKGWLSFMMSRVKGFLFSEDTVAFTQQHVTFNIFGKSYFDITKAKKAIHQLCDKECNEIVLDDEKDQISIGKMTSTQISQMRTLEESLGVRIIVMNNTSKLSIRIRGIPTDTRQAQAEIVNVFRQNEMDDKDKALASVYATQITRSIDNSAHRQLGPVQTRPRCLLKR